MAKQKNDQIIETELEARSDERRAPWHDAERRTEALPPGGTEPKSTTATSLR